MASIRSALHRFYLSFPRLILSFPPFGDVTLSPSAALRTSLSKCQAKLRRESIPYSSSLMDPRVKPEDDEAFLVNSKEYLKASCLAMGLLLTLTSCQPKAQGGLVYASSDEGNWEIYLHQTAKDKESVPESLNLSRYPSSDRYPDWSPDRSQLVFASDRKGSFDLYLLSADGEDLRLLSESPYPDTTPRWSPTGEHIVFVSDREDRNEDIYTIDPAGQNLKRLTKDPAQDYDPAWFPDGKSLTYISLRSGKPELFRQSLTGEATQLSKNGKDKRSPDVSPNGKLIAYSEHNGTQWQLILLDLSTGTSKVLLPYTKQGQLSPRWLNDQEILFTQLESETRSALYRVSLNDLSIKIVSLHSQHVREASWKQLP